MENILPLEAYYRQARPPRLALCLIFGGALGVAIEAIYKASEGLDPNSPSTGEIGWREIVWGVAGGMALGLVLRFLVWVKVRDLTRRSFAGVFLFHTPEPQEAGYTHRLPAALVRSGKLPVPGVLYAGTGRLVFVPQRGNILGREPIPIPLDRDLRATPGSMEPSPLLRFFGATLLPTLELQGADASYLFRVPDPEAAGEALRSIVGSRFR